LTHQVVLILLANLLQLAFFPAFLRGALSVRQSCILYVLNTAAAYSQSFL